jgi:monofunctional biosynthetic peptidoglycan transglycosylase
MAKKRARRLAHRLLQIILLAILASIIVVGLLRFVPVPLTAFMLERIVVAHLTHEPYRLNYHWVRYARISPYAGMAVIASEDQKFVFHHGFDVEAMAHAYTQHLEGDKLRGASTLSQQVAKNLFLWPGRSLIRKGLEAYFTILIETLWTKQRILEVYLNIAEFGRGIFGVGAASETYLHNSAARMDPDDAALLAAVLPNPYGLRADRPSAYVLERRAQILTQMRALSGSVYLHGL